MSASPPDPRDLDYYAIDFPDSSELADLSHTSRGPQRPGYQRVTSSTNPFDDDAAADLAADHTAARGLGINDRPGSPVSPEAPPRRVRYVPEAVGVGGGIMSPGQETIGASSAATTPGLNRPFLSPTNPYEHEQTAYRGMDISDGKHVRGKQSVSTLNSDHYDPYLDRSNMHTRQSMQSLRSAYNSGFDPTQECKSSGFKMRACHWLSISIYILAGYSTIGSAIFCFCAVYAPEWPQIRSGASLDPSGAILLTSILAKTIELSFATAFVAFLGQALTRRALNKEQGRGMTLAEMSMRNWIMQPGTLITHWETVKYAGITILGVLSLLAAIVAAFYTSAASALVQPQLEMSEWQPRALGNVIRAPFADSAWVMSQCKTPALNDLGDPGNPSAKGDRFGNSNGTKQAHASCLQLDYASQSYHNYVGFLEAWTGNTFPEAMSERPRGRALWKETIEVTGQWINEEKVRDLGDGRYVHSVHLAMPHVGVMQAAFDPDNGIPEPKDQDGQGRYVVRASVPSPVIHTTCVSVFGEDIAPLAYGEWPGNSTAKQDRINKWLGPSYGELGLPTAAPGNTTILDELFGWSGNGTVKFTPVEDDVAADPEQILHARPVFAKLPKMSNTFLNHTGVRYGRPSIYLIGRTPVRDDTYVVCKLETSLTPDCSTTFHANGDNRGKLDVTCEDNNNEMQFNNMHSSNATDENFSAQNKDWLYIGQEWGNALNLNDGIRDGDAQNGRILMNLALTQEGLNSSMPSPAEALAVMGSSTILMSVADSPFRYPSVSITDMRSPIPPREFFDASFQSQVYKSGVHSDAQKAFMLVLFAVLALNLLVVGYFTWFHGFVTDYSEPPNMFTIALNSPPSQTIAGSCGLGPQQRHYKVHWFVAEKNEHLYLTPGDERVKDHKHLRQRFRATSTIYEHLESGPSTPHVPSDGFGSAKSAFAAKFDKHAHRKSFF